MASFSASFSNEYYVIYVSYDNGHINFTGGNSYTSAYVRPIISLKAGTKFASGNGTTANPYIVDTT